jgi:hypothetical protein
MIRLLLFSFFALSSSGYAQPAFTGAEGFGSDTVGGRGGRVIKVVNLNASGPGSLQAACETPEPRIIVFEVSGVITGDVVITELYGLGYYEDKGLRQMDEPEMAPVKTHHPKEAYDLVLDQSGCFPLDEVTKRVVHDVISGTGSWGRKEQADLMEGLTPAKPPLDSDNDGMPDEWEEMNGYNKEEYDANRKKPTGHTAIEECLNELAKRIIRGSLKSSTR